MILFIYLKFSSKNFTGHVSCLVIEGKCDEHHCAAVLACDSEGGILGGWEEEVKLNTFAASHRN